MAPSDDTVQRDDGSWINSEFIQDIIERIHSDHEVTIISMNVQLALGKGENYLSKIFRVEVQYKVGHAESITRYFIVKSYPDGEFVQQFVTDLGVFDRELTIYRHALPAIYKFIEEKWKDGPAPCFSATTFITSRPNVVVLDDLKCQGFTIADRKKMLDLQHCRLVVQNLARLHGISAAILEQNPGMFDQYDDVMFSDSNTGHLENFLPLQTQCLVRKVRSWPGYEAYADKIENIIPAMVSNSQEDCKLQVGGFNVLCHGDCWSNNYMFKYSPTGEPIDIRFVDFQLSRLGSPALDLTYFLYSSTQNEIRRKHFDDLLTEYHTHLCETLTSLGLNSDIFSFKDLKAEMKRLAHFGFYVASVLIPVVIADAEDSPDLAEISEEDVLSGEVEPWEKTLSNSRFTETFQIMLPYLNNLGAFE